MRLLLSALCASACAGAPPAPPAAPASPARVSQRSAPADSEPSPDERCALRTARARVGAVELDRGAALVFTTSDDIGVLRRRVAELDVPPQLERVRPRLDNVHGGIRVVFEAAPENVAAVQREVHDHARWISKTCGLVLAPPHARSTAGTPRPGRSETPPPAARDAGAKPKAKASPPRPAPAKRPATTPAKPDSKPKAKPKEPTAPAKPKPLAPKPPPPSLPRLPGPNPEPLPGS